MKFKNLPTVLMVVGVIFSITGCLQTPNHVMFQPSGELPEYQQDSFEEYAAVTKQWLGENRAFLTNDQQTETEANTPFELFPKEKGSPSKGILLVHGLGDSPFFMRDLANVLAEQGFLTRVILLPGHGSRPADLILPKFEDWKKVVAHHISLLSSQVDEVWLGGFSTGGNLVTSYAAQNDNIKGLLLFSPAFIPKDFLHVLAPYANYFLDWLDFDPHDENYTRYGTLSMNGVALLSESVGEVDGLLSKKAYDKPVLIVVSESDSVIDSPAVVELFQAKFTHPRSRLVWYGMDKINDSRIISLSASLPQHRISTFSHMSVLFAPNNSFYGKNGSQLVCDNGQSEDAEMKCPTSEDLWFSSFDYVEDGKIHARLTWNPYFKDLAETIEAVIQ